MKIVEMGNEYRKNKTLEDYLSFARDMKPVSGLDDVETLIKNAGAHSIQAPQTKIKLKYKIIMTTSIITTCILATGLLYHRDAKNNTAATFKNKAQQETAANNLTTASPKNDVNRPGISAGAMYGDIRLIANESHTSPMDNILQTNFMAVIPAFTKLQINETMHPLPVTQKTSPVAPYPLNALSTVKPITIDKANLEKFGIKTGKNGLEYNVTVKGIGSITYTNSTQGCGLFVSANLKEKRGHSMEAREILTHDGPRPTQRLKYPNKPHQKLDFYPALITDIEGKNWLNIDSLLNRRTPNGDKDTSKLISLIPVLVRQYDFNGFDEKKDLVFWFTSSPALENIMKEANIPNPELIPVYRSWGKTDAEQHVADAIDVAALKGIKPLVLTNEQMEKLGFNVSRSEIAYKCTVTDKGKIDFVKTKHQFRFLVEAPMKEPEKGQDFYPVFISDMDGVQVLKYTLDKPRQKDVTTKEYFISTIRTLVPVLVKQKWHNEKGSGDLIFWFNVTPDFLAALPENISKDMGKEYQQLIKKPNEAPDNSKEITCKYFDVCQIPLEREMKMNIYPNPAQSKLNVDFELLSNSSATVSMTDLNGKIVKTIDENFSGTGAHHVEVITSDLKPGIYLVLLKMNNGVVLNNKVVINGKD